MSVAQHQGLQPATHNSDGFNLKRHTFVVVPYRLASWVFEADGTSVRRRRYAS
jgi:hypothetical protein